MTTEYEPKLTEYETMASAVTALVDVNAFTVNEIDFTDVPDYAQKLFPSIEGESGFHYYEVISEGEERAGWIYIEWVDGCQWVVFTVTPKVHPFI